MVHGEGDGLPGVVVDRYDRFAVVKLYSAGLTPHRAEIVEAIRAEVEGLAGVFGRDEIGRDDDEDEGEGGAAAGRVLWGAEPPERIAIDEHGMTVLVDVRRGQKTGHFLDQRENRHMVRELARGRPEALNLFGYTGGFSVAAALGGAAPRGLGGRGPGRHRARPRELPRQRRSTRPTTPSRPTTASTCSPATSARGAASTWWSAIRPPSRSRRRRWRGRSPATPR